MYPKNLFQAMASNLLKKLSGGKTLTMILKEANVNTGLIDKAASDPYFSTATPVTPEESAQMFDFLQRHNYKPTQFLSDPVAQSLVKERSEAAKKRINDLFEEQAREAGGLLPDMANNRASMLDQLKRTYKPAVMGEGIRNALHAEQSNPQRFSQLKELSDRSERALDRQHAPLLSGLAGTVAGGLTGASFGKTPARRWMFGLPSAVLGGIGGHFAGKQLAEHNTGYKYDDVLSPVQLADRLKRQVNADPKA